VPLPVTFARFGAREVAPGEAAVPWRMPLPIRLGRERSMGAPHAAKRPEGYRERH
jgi:hypothetical protein